MLFEGGEMEPGTKGNVQEAIPFGIDSQPFTMASPRAQIAFRVFSRMRASWQKIG
jgi:hypothetical protein